jgi:hypothetical protein
MTSAAAQCCCRSHRGQRVLLLARVSLSVANFVIIAFLAATRANARSLAKLPSAPTQPTRAQHHSQQHRGLQGAWNATHAGELCALLRSQCAPPTQWFTHLPEPSPRAQATSTG